MNIYFDTNIFIYLFEEKQPYASKIVDFIDTQEQNLKIYTSVFTLGELMIQPYKLKCYDLVEIYKTKINNFCERIIDINQKNIDNFSRIRADFPFVKPPDALHLACAVNDGLIFFTHDKQLLNLKIDSLKFLDLSDL